MSGKYALIIANTEYTDSGLAQLTAPGKDAEGIARVLSAPEIAAFDKVTNYTNENISTINEAIEGFFLEKKPDDLLVFYFSGHGVRDDSGALFLAIKNTNRARLRSTAIKADFVREMMDQSRSKRQVIILDCCNSGAFAKGTKSPINGPMGMASAFEGNGYGRVVLTATDSTQFAWEGDKIIGDKTDKSLFTHFLIKGLEGEADKNNNGQLTVDELYEYVHQKIIEHTPNQTPGKWSYKQQGDIIFRQNLPAKSIHQELIDYYKKKEKEKDIDISNVFSKIDQLPPNLSVVELMEFRDEADKIVKEAELSKQVHELNIEVDTAKKKQEISEIVDAEFFKDLAARANQLRKKDTQSKPQN